MLTDICEYTTVKSNNTFAAHIQTTLTRGILLAGWDRVNYEGARRNYTQHGYFT